MRKKGKTNEILSRASKKISYVTLVFLMMSSSVFANTKEPEKQKVDVGDVVDKINTGDGVYSTIREIIGVLAWAAFAVAVIKMMQIGIMYVLGPAKSKNDAKNALLPWLVGAFVAATFGTVGPWIIGTLMSGAGNGVFGI